MQNSEAELEKLVRMRKSSTGRELRCVNWAIAELQGKMFHADNTKGLRRATQKK